MRGVMAERDDDTPAPKVQPFVLMACAGVAVAYFSWENKGGLGGAVWIPLLLGLLFAVAGFYACVWTIKVNRLKRPPTLPTAPSRFMGEFAPDFRRNLKKLKDTLPEGLYEMVMESDYAFWYNTEQTMELALTSDGWLGFFMFATGDYRFTPELVQRAVADSPFAPFTVAQELMHKYADAEKAISLSCIAWYRNGELVVYPHDAAEVFSRFYAENLFAPAAIFDKWLELYLSTGNMSE